MHFEKGASSSIEPATDYFTHKPLKKPRRPPYYDQFRRGVKRNQNKKIIWSPTAVAFQKIGLLPALEQVQKAIPRCGVTPDDLLNKVPHLQDEKMLARLLHAAGVYDEDRDLFWSRKMGPWDRFWRINSGIAVQ